MPNYDARAGGIKARQPARYHLYPLAKHVFCRSGGHLWLKGESSEELVIIDEICKYLLLKLKSPSSPTSGRWKIKLLVCTPYVRIY